MTRFATLGLAFSLDEAFSGTIDMPYVLYMLFLRISMLSFTFILRVAAAVSLFVRRTFQASIDGLSSRICRFLSRLSHLMPLFGA